MEILCPYCRKRSCGSDDHVFPEFLGGRRTIPACATCNSRFGHRFEGPVSKDLAPIIVFLSFSGLKPKRTTVHKKAWVDRESGHAYDIDSNRQSTITKPYLQKDSDGNIRRIIARDAKEGEKIAQSLVRKGLAKGFVDRSHETRQVQPPFENVRINIGGEMRQLAVKMCVGLAQLLAPGVDVVETSTRNFLLEDSPERSPVCQVYRRYPSLDALRPALAHLIYVEADPANGRCYGVVQLFGVFQFYVPLHTNFAGPAFAGLGVLNVTDGLEEFGLREPMRLQETTREISVQEYSAGLEELGQEFNRQTQQAFGNVAITTVPTATQSLQGFVVRIPLLWVEYSAEIEMELELIPDRANDKGLSISAEPQNWVLSPDFGQTRLRVFETFVEKWNSQVLDRGLGVNHVYVPDEIGPGVRFLLEEDFWCPVHLFRIHYRVLEQAWQGSINLSNCPGILNRIENTLNTKITLTPNDVPITRDPSWQTVVDIDAFKASAQNLIIIEKRDIDVSGIVLEKMTLAGAEPD